MRIVLVDGGLGNQLFQLSFALQLADVTGDVVMIDAKNEGVRHRHGSDGLAELAEALGLAFHSGPSSTLLTGLALARRTVGTWRPFSRARIGNPSISLGNTHIYSGYWQDHFEFEKYYVRVADACREVFSLTSSNDSCLHVRLGDYRSRRNRKVYSQVGLDYYASSLRHLRGLTGIDSVKVLTNDIGEARGMFDRPEFCSFELRFERGTPLEDFSVIAQSSMLVASNSTFCWWGACISARTGGLQHLVAPATWFNQGYAHRQAPSYAKLQSLTGHPLTYASF